MTDDEFLAAFEAGRLEPFGHREHVRMAWAYARRGGGEHAVAMARRGIRRLALAAGDVTKYHETLTVSWARVVAHMADHDAADDFGAFLAAHPQLERRDLLRAHFTADRLFSAEARERLVEPDLAPLP